MSNATKIWQLKYNSLANASQTKLNFVAQNVVVVVVVVFIHTYLKYKYFYNDKCMEN